MKEGGGDRGLEERERGMERERGRGVYNIQREREREGEGEFILCCRLVWIERVR